MSKVTVLGCADADRRGSAVEWAVPLLRDAKLTISQAVLVFVGASGAGKSTLINALLGCRLVPTSGVRSCTPSAIEISYHSADRVKARIEFISRHDWLNEVRRLLCNLVDMSDHPSQLLGNARAARGKLRMVYPRLTRRMLMSMSAEEVLESDYTVASKLGSVTVFDAPRDEFLEALKGHCDLGRRYLTATIVARVSIYCDAPVLKDGITFVDLPGVFDTGTLGEEMLAKYLKRDCHICVVSPIQQAVRHKIAQDLLRGALKEQLKRGEIDN
ncbi:hypothetical protein AURDEDRAFT_159316 [Auricularia subglabra TFB-10046 SS5]|nr:hypothetical protein AURDEDRAFT_159316 [Auricularia subglabra TFB-10046 SS5]